MPRPSGAISIPRKTPNNIPLVDDCGTSARPLEFVFIDNKRKKAGHVHNVSKPQLKESIEVNRRMINFLTRYGSASPSDR